MIRRLIDYLPLAIKNVREYKAILNSGEQAELASLWDAVDAALNDQFVTTATLNGVQRWEAVLGVRPKGADSLDARKFKILSRLNERLPYTLPVLKNMLQALCGEDGYDVEVLNETYTLIVKIALTAKSNFEDVAVLLNKVVPANMVIDLLQMYNPHLALHQFTHGHLRAYTQKQLRNEVFS
jgi:hypothetical protein